MSPEERARAVIKDLCATDQLLSADGKSSLLESLVATAIREAVEDYRLKAESYDACESVARNRLAHIKPEVEALLPAICGVDQKTWDQHKEHMPINAIDMLNYAERKIAIREACNEKLEEAASIMADWRVRDVIRSLKDTSP